MNDIVLYALAGFMAQLIDGTLGMAYGLSATSLLLHFGVPPAAASATVHAAEVFTTGASAVSHHHFGNVDVKLFRRLVIPGVLGAVTGASLLSVIATEQISDFVSMYLLLMGVILMVKAFRTFPPKEVTRHLTPLGFIGAFLDTVGGGGWGPIVASNLISRGHDVRRTVGTVNAVEFFVTMAASITFLFGLGFSHWQIMVGLALGGILAAPLGAKLCRRVPPRPFMVMVGLAIIVLSLHKLLGSN